MTKLVTKKYAVWLYHSKVGSIYQRGDHTWFEFLPEYLARPDRPVLGLKFDQDLHNRSASLKLPPWFSNLLPEGILREWIAEERNVSVDREMELLAQVGQDLPGAVQVAPEGEDLEGRTPASFSSPRTEDAEQVARWRFSLAGVGLKFSMLRSGDRFTAPATGLGGDWIVKLPDPQFAGVPANEFTMMTLAERVGIDVPETTLIHRESLVDFPQRIWPGAEDFAYGVKRFDRTETRELIHIEDFAQVRGIYPVHKYHGNFETIAALAFREDDESSLSEFVRRLTFFILIGNGDAHLKNWSFIYRDRFRPALSPAYDIVATESYRPPDQPENLGMKFAGTRRFNKIRLANFGALGARIGASSDLEGIADATVSSVLAHWDEAEESLRGFPHLVTHTRESLVSRAQSLRTNR